MIHQEYERDTQYVPDYAADDAMMRGQIGSFICQMLIFTFSFNFFCFAIFRRSTVKAEKNTIAYLDKKKGMKQIGADLSGWKVN